MSDYVTEKIFLEEVSNPNLLEEELKIEEGEDTNIVVKKESAEVHENGWSDDSFPSHPTDGNSVFFCEACGKKFLKRSRLRDHMQSHSKERNHKCGDCGYAAKRKRDLIKHISTSHPKETPFQCEVCSKTFSTSSLLKQHSACHEEKPFKCDRCSTTYKNKQGLHNHNSTVHDNKGKFRCEVCACRFPYRYLLDVHALKHNKKKKHNEENQYSETNFKVKEEPEEIEANEDSEPTEEYDKDSNHETPFQCEMCPKKYRELWLLKRHSVKHTEEKSFQCDQCSNVFKWNRSLYNHKVLVHGGGGKFVCKVCGKKFLYRAKLNEHMTRHSKGRNHKCGDCGYAAKSKYDLTKHVNINHPSETPFRCEVCLKSYATSSILKLHSRKHNEEKSFQCDQCSEAFKLKESLNNHKVLVHDGGGKFPCEVCGSRFMYRAKLNEHMTKHSKGRDYKCSECDYAGKRPKDLKQHMVIHSDERDHKCGECGGAFKTKLHLNKHFRVVHRVKAPFQCEECLTGFPTSATLKRHFFTHDQGKESNSVETFEESDLKVVPSVIYDPEQKRNISTVKQEPEEEVKIEPEYKEEM